jgi:hypothetical protein
MSIAFHPDFETNGLFYVYYISENPSLGNISNGQCSSGSICVIVSEFDSAQLGANGLPMPGAERILLDTTMITQNRGAGHLAFGLEDTPLLYVSMGDSGGLSNGQNPDTLLGALSRIDVNAQDVGKAYAVPLGNPSQLADPASNSYMASNTREVYAYGFRNPWRFSFDPLNGLLYLGDDGMSFEEINVINQGLFYGWSHCEGDGSAAGSYDCPPFDGSGNVAMGNPQYRQEPILYLGQLSDGWNSMIAGEVYRGTQYADLCGAFVYADFINGEVKALRYGSSGGINEQKDLTPLSGIISFGTDEQLEVYAVSYSSGTLYQLQVP